MPGLQIETRLFQLPLSCFSFTPCFSDVVNETK